MNTNTSIQPVRKNAILTALMAAALATGFGMSTANAADTAAPQAHSDGIGAALSDTGITGKIKGKLMGEESLNKSDISVTTTNGVVTLDGAVTSSDAKKTAESLAKSVDGVKSVDNNLKAPGSSKTAAKTKKVVSDSWITTKVKSEILADSMSKGFDVSVETTNGVVVLKGTLANLDAVAHVKDIASKVKGVKSVDTEALVVGSK